ncbi:hypothetical protein BTUL_0445g00020 [Botrytis tulipae]|uniref:Uncharacterized protein n=1 Tax=Botrytis tulipae TaxID=87230 RepID=A0A4Z1E426_9HELO|nr:hypothetical protein BTUL_0445g00020 [Botrytis tulipae]
MSTEIPFTANHTQQPFKLLELPPDLLTLLESDVPPTISDTIELIEKEEEIDGQEKQKEKEPEVTKKTTTGKVNKWHEKFAKSRGSGTNTNMKG